LSEEVLLFVASDCGLQEYKTMQHAAIAKIELDFIVSFIFL